MRKMLSYMQAKHWRLFAISIALMFLQVFLDLKLPDYMSGITEKVQTGTATTAATPPRFPRSWRRCRALPR